MSKNAVIYISDRCNENISLENQLKECTKYAQDNDYNVLGVYLDSQDFNQPRDFFLDMLYEIEHHPLNEILIFSPRIFSNALYACVLNKKNVAITFVKSEVNSASREMAKYHAIFNEMILGGILSLNV